MISSFSEFHEAPEFQTVDEAHIAIRGLANLIFQRITNIKAKLNSADDVREQIDLLADMIILSSSIGFLALAFDTNDRQLTNLAQRLSALTRA